MADHVNALQDEVRAIEISLGAPSGASTVSASILVSTWAGSFVQRSETWNSVSDRLVNIEAGLLNGVPGAPYVRKAGGDTITPSSGNIALGLKTAAGNANLMETRSAANVLNFRLDKDGIPFVGNAAVIYVNSAEYNALVANTTVLAAQAAQGIHPFFLSGI